MTDTARADRLEVRRHGLYGSLVAVPVYLLYDVRRLLHFHGIRYWTNGVILSLAHEPPVLYLEFGRGVDMAAAQRSLDDIPPAVAAERKVRMAEAVHNGRLKVSPTGMSVSVPVDRLVEVRRLLDDNKVRYWTSQSAISLDGAPEVIYVYFGRGTDPAAVRRLLAGVP